jgi:hypothetical protein
MLKHAEATTMLEAKKYCKMRWSREIFDMNQDVFVKWFVRDLERQNSKLKTHFA